MSGFARGDTSSSRESEEQAARARRERHAPERVVAPHPDAHAERGPRHRPRARHGRWSSPRRYNPEDGVVFPWPFVWGFAQAARKLGVPGAERSPRSSGSRRTGREIDGGRGERRRARGRRRDAASSRRTTVVNACGRLVARRSRGCSASSCRTDRIATRSLYRTAEALAEAARRQSRATGSTSASPPAARSWGASDRSGCPRG